MFGVGMPELMIIFVIALLVFGPKELPKIAQTLGKAMAELRRASDDLRDGIQREIDNATREEPAAASLSSEPAPAADAISAAPPTTTEAIPAVSTSSPSEAGAEAAGQPVAGTPLSTPEQLTLPAPPGGPPNGHGASGEILPEAVSADASTAIEAKIEPAPPLPAHPAESRNA